jgi:hypothetical protein
VGIVSELHVGQPRNSGSIAGRGKMFSILQNLQRSSETHPASCSVCTGGSFSGIKRRGHETVHRYLMPKLKHMELYLCSPPYAFKV